MSFAVAEPKASPTSTISKHNKKQILLHTQAGLQRKQRLHADLNHSVGFRIQSANRYTTRSVVNMPEAALQRLKKSVAPKNGEPEQKMMKGRFKILERRLKVPV